ncbi:DEAD/DEAH box helicase family protein [Bacillus albus]|uniref:DEAD/DEAH box helicase n=1 Tax=Bacillus albus TaxID=2026189 RepID=UPI00301545A6
MESIDFLNDELKHALRPFQLQGLNYINNYINSDSNKQALIKMPMGTGKTAIIAIAAAYHPKIQSCLVVTASAAVRDQLLEDIRTRIWENLKLTFRPIKPVFKVLPSTIDQIVSNNYPVIYVCTVQSLLKIKEKQDGKYDLLKEKINLIMFDEGHKEPAEKWQSAIRDLEKKVVLFTATPVRNDNNQFSIDNRFVYVYSYPVAVQQGYVRRVNFTEIKSEDINESQNIELFASKMKTAYEDYIQQYQCSSHDVKMIIRCDNEEDIKSLVVKLNNFGILTKGVHDNFSNSSCEKLLNNVPQDLRDNVTQCWIHQNKFIEGIDSYKFCLLGIYESFHDQRSLVQQIGRIIRRKNREENLEANVIIWEKQNYQLDWWDSYLEYEKAIGKDSTKIEFEYPDFLLKILEINPPALYLDRQYFKQYSFEKDLKKLLKLKKYQLPRKTNIYENKLGVHEIKANYSKAVENINSELRDKGNYIIDKINIDEIYTTCFIYSYYNNSPYLVKESFIEPKIGILLFKIINNVLFFYDTSDFVPQIIKEEWRRISAQKLKNLFDSDTSFSSASIQNGSIKFNYFNRMVLHSEDLSNMVPNISDQYNFLTTVQGKRKTQKGKPSLRRYVGFSNARISQDSAMIRLNQYIKWLDELYYLIEKGTKKNSFFDRYAPVTDIPLETKPVSILLHIDEADLLQGLRSSNVELTSNFYKVSNQGIFCLKYKQNIYEIKINFDKLAGEYYLQLNNPDVELDLFYGKDKLLKWLNDNQSFQLLLSQNEYRYYKGNFYKIGIPDNYTGLSELLDENRVQLPRNGKIKEKGKYYKNGAPKTKTNIWDENSLFYMVAKQGENIKNDSQLKSILQNTEYIICTDLQSEIADFITVSESTKTVCFIHCKAGKNQLSASAFQEVCGQITKNLDYVHMGGQRLPVDVERWNGKWTHACYQAEVNRRIINDNNLSAKKIWDKLKQIQTDPNATTYVIALVGDAFTKEKYDRESKKIWGKQKPEKIQIDYLLLETAVAVERAQAKFMVAYTKKEKKN